MISNAEKVEQFLKSCGANVKIEHSSIETHDNTDTREYKYTITRKGKQLSGVFKKSVCNFSEPTAYEIFSHLPQYEPEVDLWDFARNHGYQICSQQDYDNVSCAYKEYCHNWRGVNKLFGDVIDELWEIL